MKIYTSYFGNLKALGKAGVVPISIARFTAKWFTGLRYTLVAPTGYMLSSSCTHEEYLRKYDEILQRLNPKSVIAEIERMGGGKDVALLCYEKPGDFCHRHLLADWLTKTTDYEVKEWEPEPPKEKAVQLTLFD